MSPYEATNVVSKLSTNSVTNNSANNAATLFSFFESNQYSHNGTIFSADYTTIVLPFESTIKVSNNAAITDSIEPAIQISNYSTDISAIKNSYKATCNDSIKSTFRFTIETTVSFANWPTIETTLQTAF